MGEKNVITWSKNNFLNWSDFKAESNPAVFEDSYSVIKYHCTWIVDSEQFGRDIVFLIGNIQISVEFHPVLSWVRESEISDSLLNHEQGHFDLGELVKRENLNYIQEVFYNKHYPTRGQNEEQRKQFAKEDSTKFIYEKIENLEKILFDRRLEYDKLTNFGQNQEQQQNFDKLFEKLRV